MSSVAPAKKPTAVKPPAPKAPAPKAPAAKAAEAKVSAPKAPEAKAGEPKTGTPKPAAASEPAVVLTNFVEPEALPESESTPESEAAPSDAAESKEAAPAKKPAAKGAKGKKRQQATEVLEIAISTARCMAHIRLHLGDENAEEKIAALRAENKLLKDDPQAAARIAEIKDEIRTHSKHIMRVSSMTPVAVAIVMDGFTTDILESGMKAALAGGHKTATVANLHEQEPRHLLYWPLLEKLPAYKDYNADNEEELRKQRAADNKKAREVRESRAAEAKKTAKAGKPAAKTAKSEDSKDEAGEGGERSKTTFYTYVENALKVVRKKEAFKSMRVSNRFREYVSELVAQAIARLTSLARIVVNEVAGARTLNEEHILCIFHVLLADSGNGQAASALADLVKAKLVIYKQHVNGEKSRKLEKMSAEERAKAASKAKELELGRKKKQVVAAERRSEEAAKKKSALAAEIERLSLERGGEAPEPAPEQADALAELVES